MGIWWWTSIPSLDFLRWELRKLWPVEVFSIEQRAKWQRWRHSWRHTHRHGKPPRPQGWFMVVNIHARFGLPTMGTLGDTACDIRRRNPDTSPNEYIAASGFRRCRKNRLRKISGRVFEKIPILVHYLFFISIEIFKSKSHPLYPSESHFFR